MRKKILLILIFAFLTSLLLIGCSPNLPFSRGDGNEEFIPFEINKKNIRLQKEKQYDIKKDIILFSNNVNFLSFQSEDTSVFTVDNNGIMTGVSEGDSEIIITYDDEDFVSASKILVKVLDVDLQIENVIMPVIKLGASDMPVVIFNYDDLGFSNNDLDFAVIGDGGGTEFPFLVYDNASRVFRALGIGEGHIKISLKRDPAVNVTVPFQTDFNDRTVGNLIRAKLDIPYGFIVEEDLGNVIELSLENLYISSLNDLSCLINLKKLNLNNTKFKDYSVLSKLLNLEEIYLSSNGITDADLLKDNNYLKTIDLSNNGLVNLNLSLQAIFNLEKLDLKSNLIINGDFLAQLNKITYLDISQNKITGSCNFGQVNNLAYLDISKNEITGCTFNNVNNLEYFDASINKITNCNFTQQLSKIKYLDISQNSISSACSFNTVDDLEYFNATNNRITSCTFNQAVSNLTYFDISKNSLTNSSFLVQMPNVEYLNISLNTNITSVSNLSDKINLKSFVASDCNISQVNDNLPVGSPLTHLDFKGTRISNINFLTNSKELTYVNISKTDGISSSYRISSVTPLEGCVKIKRFLAANNLIVVLLPIKDCLDLIVLDLANNAVVINSVSHVNFTYISAFKKLEELYLGGNTITNITFLNDADIIANLKRLNLGGTGVSQSNLSIVISQLRNLEWLELYQLNLTNCTSFITPANLPNLKRLKISHNKLSSSQITTLANSFRNAGITVEIISNYQMP